jgi:two-component system LytT family response regulator
MKKHFLEQAVNILLTLSWVESIETWFNGGLMVKLKGGQEIEISRRQAVKLKDMMSL